jgi:hypothetical protein
MGCTYLLARCRSGYSCLHPPAGVRTALLRDRAGPSFYLAPVATWRAGLSCQVERMNGNRFGCLVVLVIQFAERFVGQPVQQSAVLVYVPFSTARVFGWFLFQQLSLLVCRVSTRVWGLSRLWPSGVCQSSFGYFSLVFIFGRNNSISFRHWRLVRLQPQLAPGHPRLGGLINETAEEETVSRAGRTRRPIYLPNNLPYHYPLLSCYLALLCRR